MNKRRYLAGIGLIGALALGVGMIVLMMSSPSHRTVTVGPPAAKRSSQIDQAQAKTAFKRQVAIYREAGEPVRAQDLAPPEVAPGKNAATAFTQAIAILEKFDVPGNRAFLNLNVRLAMPADKWKFVNDVLDKPLAPLLAKVDEATTRPACVWDVKYASPVFRTLLLHLNGMRGVADIVRRSALSAHCAGRDDEALRRTAQLLQMAKSVDQRPFVVTHLVALGVARMASDTAAEIVPTLKIGAAPGDASEAQVKALIADFLDDAWAREALRSGMLAERLSIMDTAVCLETGKLTAKEMASVISASQPVSAPEIMLGEAYFDALPMMKRLDPMIAAARASQCLGEFKASMPPPQSSPPSIMGMMMPSLDRAAVTHFTAISRLRLSATALAARTWMIEHGGQPPAALNDLVPKYLPAIPLDPLAPADGGTFTYKLAPQPTIVGVNAATPDQMTVRLTGK